MRLNVAVPEAKVSKPVLDAALESVTRLNETLLEDGSVPSLKDAIKKQGIIWKPEPYEDEHFDHAGIVVRRGWGDCDDLAPYHAASLRHSGEDPEATAIVRKSGPHRWHAIVQRSNGDIEDPSKWAGMGKEHAVHGASVALMYPAPSTVSGIYDLKPAIAVRPERGKWQARVDIPWHTHESFGGGPLVPTDYAMASLAGHRHPVAALINAIEGGCKIGLASGIAHPEHIKRLCAIADTCDGVPFEEIAHCYGIEHAEAAHQIVGSMFGKIKNIAKKAAKFGGKLAMKGLRFVPGASQALSAYDLAKEAYDAAKTLKSMGVHPADITRLVHAGFPSVPG